uniref:Uncharacterized protein n=1 Tax=Arundo donax TaxID=35708 RepID=A0A0A8Z310_ARUDO
MRFGWIRFKLMRGSHV